MPLDSGDILKYKPLYVQTARAYVNDMQRNVGLLLADINNNDAFDVVHLSSHSLSSQSIMMNYTSLALYASTIEKLSKAKKEGVFTFTHEVLLIIDEGIKQMHESLNEIEKNGKELDMSSEIEKLQGATKVK